MKILMLFIACCILFLGIAFAGDQTGAAPDTERDSKTLSSAGLKSSPRLSYRSNGPADEKSALNKLKPMLNQVLGSGQNGQDSGAAPPGSAKYSF